MPRNKRSDEIKGPKPRLARTARAMIGKLSLRAVVEKTGGKVSTYTVTRLMDGYEIGPSLLDQISVALRKNPNILRVAGGYGVRLDHPIPEDPEAAAEQIDDAALEDLLGRIPPDILGYLEDPDVQQVVRYYKGMPPALQPGYREAMRSAADLVKEAEDALTTGKRANREEDPSKPGPRRDTQDGDVEE